MHPVQDAGGHAYERDVDGVVDDCRKTRAKQELTGARLVDDGDGMERQTRATHRKCDLRAIE